MVRDVSRPFGGHSSTAPLRRVLVCPPEAAGWEDEARREAWSDLGYLHPPEPGEARRQHQALRERLAAAGAEVLMLPPGEDLGLDAVYVHDASLTTERGLVLLRMGKPSRRGEPPVHGRACRDLGIPILGAIEEPGTLEGGDVVWLDEGTLLAGRGYRSNAAGIAQLRAHLDPLGVAVLEAPLPHAGGPSVCLHLMSLVSPLDAETLLVDLPWLAVETVELLRARRLRLIEIEPEERESLACNVLALGEGRLLALEANPRTNDRLRRAGFDVRTFPGTEIAWNGSGGPTCLTRPLLRG
jgi:N-dimethylarginine dimethylaminohydrolase